MTFLTRAAAQALHNDTTAHGRPPIWVVAVDATKPGRIVAYGYAESHGGGELLGVLSADLLDGPRAMLPAGLTKRG